MSNAIEPKDDDAQLRGLLREWRAPETPASLEQRVLGRRLGWWQFLIGGYIRVPVPVACGLLLLLSIGAWRAADRAPSAPCVAERPAAPAGRIARTLPPAPCEHPAPGVC